MLVLSRRINEKIVLPSIKTTVQVIGIKSGAIRIGIDAPDDVPIFRDEVFYRAGAPPSATYNSNSSAASKPLQAIKDNLALLRRRLANGVDSSLTAILDAVEKELAVLEQRRAAGPQTVAVSS